jgi:uncharacterized protein
MRLIDPHLHMEFLTADNMMHMWMCGITDIIGHVWYPPVGIKITNQKLEDFYEKLLGFDTWRAEQYMLRAHVGLGINPFSVPDEPDLLLDRLPDFLKNEKVVAVGEIGFHPGSPTCKDLQLQEHIYRRQIVIARETGLPAVCHTPTPSKLDYINKMLDIAEEYGLPMDKIIIEHVTADTIDEVLKRGAWASISIQPGRGIYPQDAAKIVLEHGVERVMIDGDINVMPSDPLIIPKTRFFLKKQGLSDQKLEQLFLENIRQCFNIN